MLGAFAPFHHGCSNDNIGGHGRLWRQEKVLKKERTGLCHQLNLLLVEKFISGVVDTGEQFITGVVDTSQK
jgi:hypothetical protein